jgi:coenzyme Q-binding protein COQ10
MPTHDQHATVPYRDDQLFDLVADVAKYPEFLPWCVAARLRSRTATEMVADLTIGFGPFRESFTSRVSLDSPRHVRVTYENGPFKYLHNTWDFTAVAQGCRVDFHVDFEFRNRLLSRAIGVVFQEAVRRMVAAFMKRARDIYGAPTRVPLGAPAGTATVKTEV